MPPSTGPTIISKIKSEIIQPIIYLLIALAVGYFLFGLMQFVKNQDNETAKEEGKRHMLWGVVGIAIMFSVYGILNLLNGIAQSIT